jgi:glutamate racemase
LLGCTHFPVLVPALRKVLGPDVAIVDSAATTAVSLADVLAGRGVLRHEQAAGRVMLLATDGPERFARVGAVFLGRPLAPADVEIVDLPFAPAASGV